MVSDARFQIKVPTTEKEAWRTHAYSSGVSLAMWIRQTLNSSIGIATLEPAEPGRKKGAPPPEAIPLPVDAKLCARCTRRKRIGIPLPDNCADCLKENQP